MDVDTFIKEWKNRLEFMAEHELSSFADNLRSMGEKPFQEWISIWVAWSELSSDEDIKNFHIWDE